MSVWPFEALGIDADADERTVRRAYARLLKRHRPDDDPEGFQRINEAYQACMHRLGGNAPAARSDTGIDTSPALPAVERATIPAEPDPVDAPRFKIGMFITALSDFSRTASGRDVLGWLQAHPAFYSVGAREAFAHQIVYALLQAPALPPRHMAAVLHFLELDMPGPARARLEPFVTALERHAHMTLEDAHAIRRPYTEASPPSSSSHLAWMFGGAIWIGLLAMLSVSRCSGAAA